MRTGQLRNIAGRPNKRIVPVKLTVSKCAIVTFLDLNNNFDYYRLRRQPRKTMAAFYSFDAMTIEANSLKHSFLFLQARHRKTKIIDIRPTSLY